MIEYPVLGQFFGIQGINPDLLEQAVQAKDAPYLVDGNNILVRNAKVEKLKGVNFLQGVSTQLGADGYRRVLGVSVYDKYSTSTKRLMAVTPTKLYRLSESGGVYSWVEVVPSEGGGAISGTADSAYSFANLDDKFVFVLSGDSSIWSYDGTTLAKLLDPESIKARFLLEYKTHLILLRTIESATEYYQKFRSSAANDFTTYPDNLSIDLDVEGAIQGGRQLGDAIMVYFPRGIQRVYWADDDTGYVHSVVSEDVGLYAPKTLTGGTGVHFFLSHAGVMQMGVGEAPRPISDKKFNKLILDRIDPKYYHRATFNFFPHLNMLFISYPSSGADDNDTQLIYDVSTGELISKKLLGESYSSYGAYEKDVGSLSNDERRDYGLAFIPLFGTANGYVKEQCVNAYQDGSAPYETNLVFPPTCFGELSNNKRVLQIDLLIEKLTDSPVPLQVRLANEANQSYSYNYTIAGTGGRGVRRLRLTSDDNNVGVDVLGREFMVSLRDINNVGGWNFVGIILRGYPSTMK